MCSPDCCGIKLNFLLFAEKRAVLLGLGDQLLAQQQIFNMFLKSLVKLSLLICTTPFFLHFSGHSIYLSPKYVQKIKCSEAKNFKNVTLSFPCIISILCCTLSIIVTRNFHRTSGVLGIFFSYSSLENLFHGG